VALLKWLVRPRITWPVMMIISMVSAPTSTTAARSAARLRRGSTDRIQAIEAPYRTIETENLKTLSQIGAPVSTRSSANTPTSETTVSAAIAAQRTTRGRFQRVMSTASRRAGPVAPADRPRSRPPVGRRLLPR
jgi:hypothetical protein